MKPRRTFGAVPASGLYQRLARVKGSTVRKVMAGLLVSLLLIAFLRWMTVKPYRYSPSFTLRDNNGADPDVPPLKWIIPEKFLPTMRWKLFHRDFSAERVDSSSSTISTLAFQEYGDELRHLLMDIHMDSPSLAWRKRLKDRAPWLKGYPSDDTHWPFSTLPTPIEDGKAVMICAGEPQLAHLKTLVYAIRVIHQSSIPIRIVFRDETDLSVHSQQQVLESLANKKDPNPDINIQFIDLSKLFDLDAANLKAGWNLKPFGLLAVPETQVMTLDVDVILLQSPEKLFDMKGYKDTGALFFHDRMFLNLLGFYDPGVLAQALQPNLSQTAQDLIHYGGAGQTGYRSEFIMESGLVLLDKKRRIKGVWAICLLMGREDIREYAQGYYVYGDKEMYFIGLETVSEPYSFPRFYPGAYSSVATDFKGTDLAVSPKDDPNQVTSLLQQANTEQYALCGRLLHFDDDGQPLWSNGGYFTKEEDWKSSSRLAEHPLNPLWYIDGGEWNQEEFIPNVPIGTMPTRGIFAWFEPRINPEIRAILEGAEKVWKSVIKQNTRVNQYWRIHEGMGVMCLYSNKRGIRTVPPKMADAAFAATKRYFVSERGMAERELLWGK